MEVLELTKENYKCPKGEEMIYHCRIEQKYFDSKTGERLSVPRLQKFGQKWFENGGLHALRGQGYTIDILHDPKEWYAAHKAEIEKAEAKKKAAAEKAAKEKAAKEREELKKEMLADFMKELEAKGMVIEKKK